MKVFDQLQRELNLKNTPKRIVCLVPSLTELLVDLGLEENLVGITRFCVHPLHLKKSKTIVGGTKDVDFEKVKALQPDIFIANKEENPLEMVQKLEEIAPVHVSDIASIEDNLDLIQRYGNLFSVEEKANSLKRQIETEYSKFQDFIEKQPKRKVAYLIWKDPIMVAGGDSFINEMMNVNLLENIFESEARYPQVEMEQLQKADYLLLSSEPFPFQMKHLEELSESFNPNKILFVDGEFFSWYGSRLIKAFRYFKKWHQAEFKD